MLYTPFRARPEGSGSRVNPICGPWGVNGGARRPTSAVRRTPNQLAASEYGGMAFARTTSE